MSEEFASIRDEYDTPGLELDQLDPDPLAQARAWLQAAVDSGEPQPNAASLATATATGRPSVRMLLVKEVDTGFIVYTNYESRKGRQLGQNPWGAICLTWPILHRQIRTEGAVERVSPDRSDAYFATRPRGAQIAALVSRQSSVLSDRGDLEQAVAEAERAFPREVPRPDDWGGYRLIPDRMEFWQGRRSRMHDRIEYRRSGEGWDLRRLFP